MQLPGFTAEVSVYEKSLLLSRDCSAGDGRRGYAATDEGLRSLLYPCRREMREGLCNPRQRVRHALSGQRMRRLRPVHMHKKLCWNADSLLRGRSDCRDEAAAIEQGVECER